MQETSLRELAVILHADERIAHERMQATFRRLSDVIETYGGIAHEIRGDGTVTGTGVVLAQRIEQVAEHGGVCIQGAVYETVPRRFPSVDWDATKK